METLPLDQNGHLFGKGDSVQVHRFTAEETKRISERAPERGTIAPMISDHLFSYSCAWCDAWKDFQVIGDVVKQPEPCPFPEGITTTTYLAVPSGKIVVYDDLRYVYDGFHDTFASYNSALGQHQVIEAFAKLGCAFGPVSNTCPDLFRTGEDMYAIASLEYDDDERELKRILPDGWTRLGGVITDLCAYSIADHDDYLAKGGSLDTGRGTGPDVVEVPPGTYRFTHHTGERGFDHYAPGTVIFAHIERIKETG